MALSNTEQEMIWVDAWNDLNDLIEKFPSAYILLPGFQETTKGEAERWIQDSAYDSKSILFKVDYFKGKRSIFISSVPPQNVLIQQLETSMVKGLESIVHVKDFATQREEGNLSNEEITELFDAIDSMDLEELSTLYALVNIGSSEVFQEFKLLKKRAMSIGFSLVNELFELNSLGSALTKGLERIEFKSI